MIADIRSDVQKSAGCIGNQLDHGGQKIFFVTTIQHDFPADGVTVGNLGSEQPKWLSRSV